MQLLYVKKSQSSGHNRLQIPIAQQAFPFITNCFTSKYKNTYNFHLDSIDDWSIMCFIMNDKTTKERILEAAEEIMLENSFHSVGLKQILDVAKVPKGSFYHYFKSKDQFGAEMLKHYMEEVGKRKRQMLMYHDTESDPLQRLFNYLDGSIDFIQSVTGKFPCLALKLASEVSDLSEAMRQELTQGFEQWIEIFCEVLDEAIDKKLLPASFDSASEAQLIQDLWSGSVQRAVINHNSEPVRNAVQHIKSRISSMTVK